MGRGIVRRALHLYPRSSVPPRTHCYRNHSGLKGLEGLRRPKVAGPACSRAYSWGKQSAQVAPLIVEYHLPQLCLTVTTIVPL